MLLSLWFLIALVVAAAGALLAWVAFGVRRRAWRKAGRPTHGGWRLWVTRALSAVGILALSAAAAADGFNRHFSYVPTFAALRGDVSPDLRKPSQVALGPAREPGHVPDHGVVDKVTIPGPVSGIGDRTSYVYLPPAYFDPAQSLREFPVLYLIHGSPGTAIDWLRGGYVDRSMDMLLKQHAIEPFIVVLPDVNGGYRRDVECQDVVGGPQAQTYLVTDVVSWVDTHYRTVPDRKGRAIGGLSTGGYCGINLTLRHQDVFSAAVSHSGYGRPDRNAYTGDLFGGDKALRDANTPNLYAPTIPLKLPLGVYLDAGAGDGESRRGSTALYEVLHRRGVSVTLDIVQGESHDFVAWRQNLRLSLPWVSRWFTEQGVESSHTVVSAPDTSDLPPPSPTDSVKPATPAPGACPKSSTGAPTPAPPVGAGAKPAALNRCTTPKPVVPRKP
jgi:enterochelin esterase-like enzyme